MAKEPEEAGEPQDEEPTASEPEEGDDEAADEGEGEEAASQPKVKPPYGLIAVVAVLLVGAVGLFVWNKRKNAQLAQGPQSSASTSSSISPSGSTAVVAIPSGSASVLDPNKTPPPANLALEIWIKEPNHVAANVLPKITPPAPKPFDPTLANFLKQGLPEESQKDVDAVDFTKPLACVVLAEEDGVKPASDSMRFVWAAVVKDPTSAALAVARYAEREKAVKEHSNALNVDAWKGTKTGRYLALVGSQVMLASDLRAIEEAAARLASGITFASAQTHDVVARAPHSFLEGPLAAWVQAKWVDWSAPQLGGATTGPAKQFFDDMAASARSTFVGASEIEIDLDLNDTQAHATATLSVAPGSPFSQFLAAFPATDAQSLLAAPRDALGVIAFNAPRSWLDTLKRFLVTPPPGAEGLVPEDERQSVEKIFDDVGGALDGEILYTRVSDPPAAGTPGATELRFKVKDAALAKQAATEFAAKFLPKEANPVVSAITGDGGGAGESTEITIPTQPPQAPLPPIGFAWILRDSYLYAVAGTNPKARVQKLAGTSEADHLAGDPDMVKRTGTMAAHEGLALLVAPLRADIPFAKEVLHIAPRPDAIDLTIETTPSSVVAKADVDVDLALLVLQLTMSGGAIPVGPGGPVTTATMPAPTVVNPGPGPGQKPPPTAPPTNTTPPPVDLPAPTGFVIPIPKPGQGKSY